MNNLNEIHNKKILVQTSYHYTPHLETEMEIVERLLQQNNTVYWLVCNASFKTCFGNPDHEKTICKSCNQRVVNGVNFLNKNKRESSEKIIQLQYDSFIKFSDFESKFSIKNEFSSVTELKVFKYKTYDVGMATASSLVSICRDHNPNLANYKDFVFRGLLTGAYLYDALNVVVDQIEPDLVVLFNGRFIENRPALRVCQERKLNYATHERGGKIDSFLFRLNSIPHSIETVSQEMESLWKDATDDKQLIGEAFYKNRIKGVEDAWYSFTKDQQIGRLPSSFESNQNKRVISIFNSSLDEYEGLEGFGPYFYKNDNEGIEEICKTLENNENVKLYLRVHPNLKGLDNNQNKFLNETIASYKSVEIIAANDVVDTYELIRRSDIIVVFGSTVGIEAAFSGKKVILLGRAAYEKLNCVYIPQSHTQLMEALTNPEFEFPDINKEDALKYGYWNESFGYKYKSYKPSSLTNGSFKGVIINDFSPYKSFRRRFKKFVRGLFNKK